MLLNAMTLLSPSCAFALLRSTSTSRSACSSGWQTRRRTSTMPFLCSIFSAEPCAFERYQLFLDRLGLSETEKDD